METNRCSRCGHAREAHLDGKRCVLCLCMPVRPAWVQGSLTFRSALPVRVTDDTRKR